MPLERDQRKTERGPRMCCSIGGFESVVVGGHDPGWIVGGLDELRRHRIARQPELHRPIVDGIGDRSNFGAGIGGVFGRADEASTSTRLRVS